MERIPFTCTYDCGGRCELVACVQDGRLIRIDTPAERTDTDALPRLIPCQRGRGQGRLRTARERLLKPLRRVGVKGSDEFREVTWEEALDEVADRLKNIHDHYGAEAILHIIGYGSIGGRGFNGASASERFFSHWGSVTGTHGNPSSWCAGVADQWMLGGCGENVYSSDILKSRLIILWGMNPAENRHGIDLAHYVNQARNSGARVILIDPRYTDSGILADQWIPIKPGADTALVAAIAWVWTSEGIFDSEFITKYTVGYSDYRRYLLGEDDGTPKTPEWASKITGISEDVIRQLAQDYAAAKPAILLIGLGPQRSRYGEQVERALITLACMSGNVGISGGGFAHGGRHPGAYIPVRHLPFGQYKPARSLKVENWAQDILDGNLKPPIKMAYIVATNAINRSSNTLANAKALEQIEYVVVNEQFFTPTARYADIVFPICTDLERADIVGGQGCIHYNRQSLKPIAQSQTDYWVFAELAERLGFGEAYTDGKSEAEWLEYFLQADNLDADVLRHDGIMRSQDSPPTRLGKFRENPAMNPLNTQSGLIEITCPSAEKYGLPIIPSHIGTAWEKSSDYPLRLITPHSKLRANSSGYANPWLQRLEPHVAWINSQDAKERGIKHGDMVEVFNQYGVVIIKAKVTERIIPGTVCIYQGVWYRPGKDGVDEGGCANVLTGHHTSQTGGMAVHSEWVDVGRKKS